MTTTKTVTKLEPTIRPITQPLKRKKKRNAAGYGRVSTDLMEQESSFEAQVEYYTKMIQANPDWNFCGVYADEGITGTSTKGREQFNRMIQDALDGKLDLIITNSVITKGQFLLGLETTCIAVSSLFLVFARSEFSWLFFVGSTF